uniref:Acyl-coenzyme A oxidase 2, peroxisomal-like n=1 Tax=Tanacetum cinerariifolium TaxID=118510 RepID=A0A6L2KVV1_TANCI|nr:acyl-coenzyme A oxidase 2, peroxisomal-like [Tanacetum cinerariifolium]
MVKSPHCILRSLSTDIGLLTEGSSYQYRVCRYFLMVEKVISYFVAGELLKQYKDKFLMNTYLSQSNPVTTRWEKEEHLQDSIF